MLTETAASTMLYMVILYLYACLQLEASELQYCTYTYILGLVCYIEFVPNFPTLLPHNCTFQKTTLTHLIFYNFLQHMHWDGNLDGGYVFCIYQVVPLYVLFCTSEHSEIRHLKQLANCRQQKEKTAAFISVGSVLR